MLVVLELGEVSLSFSSTGFECSWSAYRHLDRTNFESFKKSYIWALRLHGSGQKFKSLAVVQINLKENVPCKWYVQVNFFERLKTRPQSCKVSLNISKGCQLEKKSF